MIKTVNIKVSAGNVQAPLGPFYIFKESAASLTITDVPKPLGVRTITGVTVKAKNAETQETGYAATRVGSAWGVTVPGAFWGTVGTITNGIVITATGKADDGTTTVTWTLGAGQVIVLDDSGVITAEDTRWEVDWYDSQPSSPKKGAMCKIDGIVKVYTRNGWVSLGGGVSDYDDLTSRPQINSVTLTGNKTLANLGIEAAGAAATAVSTHDASASAHATKFAAKLDAASGDSSVAWNDDGNLAMTGGKFVGNFDGEFMAAAWNDYKIDLGGGETADLPEELAAQIGNHNTANDAHSTKFAAKQDAISDLATIRSGAAAGATAVQSFSSVGGVTPTVASGVANLSTLFSSDNTLLQKEILYQTDTPTASTSTSGTVETTSVTASPKELAAVTVAAPASGNTTALSVTIDGADSNGVRNVILDVTNNDTAADCPIGIANTGAVARIFDGAAAKVEKGSRAIVTLTKLGTANEWLVTVGKLAAAS